MPTGLVLSGGVAHDFPALSAEVAAVLGEVGIAAEVTEDVDAALSSPGGVDLVVFSMLRWTMQVERYAAERARWAISLSDGARAGLREHLGAGRGVLALHAASICFDDWPEWPQLLGGAWRWGRSSHPPLGPIEVAVHAERSAIVAGLPAEFTVDDEAYGFLDLAPDVVPLLSSAHGGVDHPLLWTRRIGGGRLVHDALGHDVPSLRSPVHRTVVRRSALWALRLPDGEVAAG